MASYSPSLTELASKISAAASVIDGYCTKNSLPQPSFDVNGPAALPNDPEVQVAKMQMQDALTSMTDLLLGPNALMSALVPLIHDLSVLNLLNQYDFWDTVPLTGSATYSDIASKVNLSELLVRRALRHAMTRHIFAETTPGSEKIVHTSISAAPIKNPLLCSYMGHNLEEVAPAALNLVATLKRYGESVEPTESALVYTFLPDSMTGKTVFDWFEVDGEGDRKGWRVKRFGEAMSYVLSNFNPKAIHSAFDWDGLGDATFVDVGGSAGHVSFELATVHPKLKCIVQDRPMLEESFNANRPAALANRVSFQEHDFFKPQPIHGADIYFLKNVLHDWSDPYAIKILQQLTPAMKPSSRILIMEGVIPPAGTVPSGASRLISGLDIQMMVGLNARGRTAEDWAVILKEADERLILRSINQPLGSPFAIIEGVLQS